MKRLFRSLLCLLLLASVFATSFVCFAKEEEKSAAEVVKPTDFSVDAPSALLMEASTGQILFEQNANEERPPASVTKIMTLLLVMEAMEGGAFSLSDTVQISPHAASMGGSQVFLEEGERMSVEDLLKCTVIASANDAAVALAELVAGSEEAFVARMNARAAELGLTGASFENVTGLDDTTTHHVLSAMDIALITRELLAYPLIFSYSSLWQDTIRGGAFTLTNTNRLVRFYDGCNGLKTGSTDDAGFCVTTTATRGDMTLIAVVMGASSRDTRNDVARRLLDYGFTTYEVLSLDTVHLEDAPVRFGRSDSTPLLCDPYSVLIPKGASRRIEEVYDLPEYLTAPLTAADQVGSKTLLLDGAVLYVAPVRVGEAVQRISFFDVVWRYISAPFGRG